MPESNFDTKIGLIRLNLKFEKIKVDEHKNLGWVGPARIQQNGSVWTDWPYFWEKMGMKQAQLQCPQNMNSCRAGSTQVVNQYIRVQRNSDLVVTAWQPIVLEFVRVGPWQNFADFGTPVPSSLDNGFTRAKAPVRQQGSSGRWHWQD